MSQSTFDKLWSGTGADFFPKNSSSWIQVLTDSSDYSFEKPPGVVERWNTGEVGEFRQGDWKTSLSPENTEMHSFDVRNDDRVESDWLDSFGGIKDGYIRIASVDPSTVFHRSKNDSVRYIGSSGKVGYVADFRVELPEVNKPNICSFGFRNIHKDRFVNIHSVELKADGEVLDNSSKYASVLDFDHLPEDTDRLTVEAALSMEWTVEKPSPKHPKNCSKYTGERETIFQNVTVTDSVNVTRYSFTDSTAKAARYPDGSGGLYVSTDTPWATLNAGNTSIHSSIWFYTARNKDWDSLRRHTSSGIFQTLSDTQPLDTYAYPSSLGVSAEKGRVEHVAGNIYQPPEIPSSIAVDVVNRSYVLPDAVSLKLDELYTGNVTMTGLVRDVTARTNVTEEPKTIRGSNLSLQVVGGNYTSTTLTVVLNGSRGPIETRGTAGKVVVVNRSVNTSKDGRVNVTVPTTHAAVISAEYQPTPWWNATQPHLGDSATAAPHETHPPRVRSLIQFAAILLVALVFIYFADKTVGLGVWPPWRNL